MFGLIADVYVHIDVNGVYKVCFEGVFFRKCGHFAMSR